MPFSPLDDIYAELGLSRPQAGAPVALPAGMRPPPPPDYTPTQQNDLIDTITGHALTGLEWVGGLLDKTFGGRALRGVLGGKPEELLSLIPGSDTLRITNPANRVSGKELLGLQNDDSWTSDVGGIAAEVALDPATYLSLGAGALTKGGRLAKQLGILPKTLAGRIAGKASVTPEVTAQAAKMGIDLADVLNKPLGGWFGLGRPFGHPAADALVFGTGDRGLKAAEWLGNKMDWLKYSSLGRGLSRLEDPVVQGAGTEEVQRLLRGSHAEELGRTLPSAREQVAKIFQEAGPYDPAELRRALEGQSNAYPQIISQVRPLLDEVLQKEQAAGSKIVGLTDPFGTEYFPRSKMQLDRAPSGGGPNRPLSGQLSAATGREDLLRGIPGGTGTIEDLLKMPGVGGTDRVLNPLQAQAAVQAELLGRAPKVMAPGVINDLWQKGGDLADYFGTLSPQQVQAGMYNVDPFFDLLRRVESSPKSVANLNAAKSLLADPALLGRGLQSFQVGEATKPLGKLLDEVGFSHDAVQNIAQSLGIPVNAADTLHVPSAIADDLTRLATRSRPSDAAGQLLRGVDSATGLTKAMQTVLWPAFHVRNLFSSTAQNLAQGANPVRLWEATGMAKRLRAGEAIPGIAAKIPEFAGLTDQAASAALGRELFAHQAGGRGMGQWWRDAPAEVQALGRMIPGHEAEPTLGQIAKTYLGKGRVDAAGKSIDPLAARLDPRNIAGYGGFLGQDLRAVDQFAPVVAGRQAAEFADDMTRIPYYLERRLAGYSPAAAAEATTATHFNYATSLTDFDRQWLRRLVPFVSWKKNVIQQVLGEISRNPGGVSGMSVRAANVARDAAGGLLPPWLGRGAAIPLGDEESGKRTMLTQLGLPFEDVLGTSIGGPGGLQRALTGMLSELNPLIKAPIEYGAGKEFFANRELTDANARFTGNALADLLLGNLPTGRFATTGAMLAGPQSETEKLVNLLSGLKIKDMDVQQGRDAAVKEALTDAMANNERFKKHVNYYVPEAEQMLLTPEEQAILRLSRQLQRSKQKTAK